jgi:hypothetical protein
MGARKRPFCKSRAEVYVQRSKRDLQVVRLLRYRLRYKVWGRMIGAELSFQKFLVCGFGIRW